MLIYKMARASPTAGIRAGNNSHHWAQLTATAPKLRSQASEKKLHSTVKILIELRNTLSRSRAPPLGAIFDAPTRHQKLESCHSHLMFSSGQPSRSTRLKDIATLLHHCCHCFQLHLQVSQHHKQQRIPYPHPCSSLVSLIF